MLFGRSLLGRISGVDAMNEAQRCPACGKPNACAIDSASPCWCAVELPLRMPLATNPDAACYCRDCLQRLLADVASDPKTSTGT
ncbi:MAG: cysteine-rich CWC family protein [Burkholderiales bacterium]|nr:cysteine-rich CWC family protein [Burkholderiales bacterium]